MINQLLEQAVVGNESDVHLSSGQLPMWRIDGDVHVMPQEETLTDQQLEETARSIDQLCANGAR